MTWARRGLATLFFVASVLFASPAHAANPHATFSFNLNSTNIDNSTCEASAETEWSNQPGGISRAFIGVCDDTLVCNGGPCPCAIVADSSDFSPPSNKTSSLSGANGHALSPSVEPHMFHFVGILFIHGQPQLTIVSGELPRNCTCSICGG
jgi:hypothetical protein